MKIDRRTERLLDDGLDVKGLKSVKLVHHYGNPSVRRRLQSLSVLEYTSCMILGDQGFEQDTMQADSRSLATLLLLRDLQLKERLDRLEQSPPPAGGSLSDAQKDSEEMLDVAASCPIICEV